MQLHGNTVLITGGSSGAGLALAAVLLEKGNRVLICGRSEEKLAAAKRQLPQAHIFRCNIADANDCRRLCEWVAANHPDCNILVNNAAIVHRKQFLTEPGILEMGEQEFSTNVLGPIRLIKMLIPLLTENRQPAVVNITTGLVYAPKAAYPFYNATKAALHAFTQVLRLQAAGLPVKIFEVMLPAMNTPWHEGNPPAIAIPVEKAVAEMLCGLEKDKPEIRVAGVKLLYLLSRIAPGLALRKINAL
ncbi:SDR family NAD(P)-dependent oxidoreductase [Chitinophaga lutea]|uniref:SDR family NAD(P)-dependent oxidoreductase n=1 Tax=Chitinophaga lutea TaxID=2488634 RepID=A0A3N4PAQ6_9BACT|nr:SDR family NAD(P)-dependent oxidoreductase [Chitinophaga lutea]RPE05723.1 SDR family NAD(P)-dependent oxidoreductase [Chitinophaga lutea]